MIEHVIAQLKTGTIKNVAEFGDASLPTPPYIVVKQENDILGRGTALRIIVHMLPGQQTMLRKYIRKDIPTLLDNFATTTGNANSLKQDDFDNLPEMILGNDDKTISMERLYYYADKW